MTAWRQLYQEVAYENRGEDVEGWSAVAEPDPRAPELGDRPWRLPGPWMHRGALAHGLLERRRADGLVDRAVALEGWLMWRWRGPRSTWRHPLQSAWNPVLSRQLVVEELKWALAWPGGGPDWAAGALLEGWLPGGIVSFDAPRRLRAWRERARGAGLEVRTDGARCAWAARAGQLDEHFDVAALAEEYLGILPIAVGRRAAEELMGMGQVRLIDLVCERARWPGVATELALGYPVEMTAGSLLSNPHRVGYHPFGAEHGAYCPRCERTSTLGFSQHRRDLVVWGVVEGHGAAARVRAYKDYEIAKAAAAAAGPIAASTSSTRAATTLCSRLAYYHVALGWVFAAIGVSVPGRLGSDAV